LTVIFIDFGNTFKWILMCDNNKLLDFTSISKFKMQSSVVRS